jgi:hypothetical protein
MGPSRIGLLLALLTLWTAPAWAQVRPSRCLHGESETEVQAQRRTEAFDATDLINRLIERRPRGTAYPKWEAFAKSPMVAQYLGIAGARGDLARKIMWGSDQPLPGWRIHYVAAQDGYAFSLIDIRDPCQFTLSTNDTQVIIEGRPADWRSQPRTIPLDSSH